MIVLESLKLLKADSEHAVIDFSYHRIRDSHKSFL